MTSAPPTDSLLDGTSATDAGERISLPPSALGDRARRRRRRRRQERRRTLVVLGVALALAAAVPLLFVFGWTNLRSGTDADDGGAAEAATDDAAAKAAVSSTLVLLAPPGGAPHTFTVVVGDADGTGGSVLFLPAGSMVEIPSFGLDRLGAAFDLGGLALVQQATENLLGVRFDDVVILDPAALEGLIRPAGPLTVDIPTRVEEVEESGRVNVLFEAGPTTVEPGQVAQLLEARGQGTDLDRLVRHQAFWQAWLAAIGAGPEAAGPPGTDLLPRLIRSLAAGDARFHTLPVEALATGLTREGDIYAVDRKGVAALVRRIFGTDDDGAATDRIRVQVLNGTGEPGLAQRVTPLLVDAGAEATLVGNADRFDYATTQVVYYDEEKQAMAQSVRDAVGVGEVVRSRQELDVVDVTIVVGKDFPTEGGG